VSDLRPAVDHIRSEIKWLVAHASLDFFMEDVRLLLEAYEELNNAICWDTACLNCASLLDRNYEQYVKLDKVRAVLAGEA
jgi:hypothetical protein